MLEVDDLAVKNSYNTHDLGSALKEFARLREDNLRLLRALPAGHWKRSGMHPKRGEITIEKILEIVIDHDRGHCEQMSRAIVAT